MKIAEASNSVQNPFTLNIQDVAGDAVNFDTFNPISMSLSFGGTTINSGVAGVFDWITYGTLGKVVIDLFGQTLPIGTFGAQLVGFNSEYPAGVTLARFKLVVTE